MLRINLKRQNALNFTLHTDFESYGDSFDKAYQKYLELLKTEFVFFADVYTAAKSRTAAVYQLTHLKDRTFHLFINYEANSELPRPPKSIQRPDKIFELLQPLEGVSPFAGRATFSYPTNKFQNRLRLPIRLTSIAGSEADFDEIRGFRLVKYGDEMKIKYDITVDQVDPEDIYQTVSYSYVGKLTPSMVGDAFSSAVEISRRFVQPVGAKE